MWHCDVGRVPDVSKYRSAFIVKVNLQCFYLDLLGLCMSVVSVCVAGCRIQNPTVHPVCKGFRKNCNWKSTEISPAGAASKRTWHQALEPVLFLMIPCGVAAICQNGCLNLKRTMAVISLSAMDLLCSHVVQGRFCWLPAFNISMWNGEKSEAQCSFDLVSVRLLSESYQGCYRTPTSSGRPCNEKWTLNNDDDYNNNNNNNTNNNNNNKYCSMKLEAWTVGITAVSREVPGRKGLGQETFI
jgi:hypothetical protein